MSKSAPQPDLAGEWVRLAAQAILAPAGAGLAETVLGDRGGPVGRCVQCLLVELVPPASG